MLSPTDTLRALDSILCDDGAKDLLKAGVKSVQILPINHKQGVGVLKRQLEKEQLTVETMALSKTS